MQRLDSHAKCRKQFPSGRLHLRDGRRHSVVAPQQAFRDTRLKFEGIYTGRQFCCRKLAMPGQSSLQQYPVFKGRPSCLIVAADEVLQRPTAGFLNRDFPALHSRLQLCLLLQHTQLLVLSDDLRFQSSDALLWPFRHSRNLHAAFLAGLGYQSI